MKISIYGGEGFPLYQINDYDHSSNSSIEVDEITLNRWKEAFEKFSLVQEEITQKLDEQGKGDQVWVSGIWYGFNLTDINDQ